MADGDRPSFDWVKVLATSAMISIPMVIWARSQPKPTYSFADDIRDTISRNLGLDGVKRNLNFQRSAPQWRPRDPKTARRVGLSR